MNKISPLNKVYNDCKLPFICTDRNFIKWVIRKIKT